MPASYAPSLSALALRHPSLPRAVAGPLTVAHLLSLDAVAVALVWQAALGRAAGLAPTWAERAALGLSVAIVYLLDRQLDASRLDPAAPATLRHRLHRRHARRLTPLLLPLLAGLCVAAAHVGPGLLRSGLALGGLTALYLCLVQAAPRLLARGGKELCVGVVFAAGCGLHLLSPGAALGVPAWAPFASVGLAAGLFTLNCLMIGAWESSLDRAQGLPAFAARPLLRPAGLALALAALAWGTFGTLTGREGRAAVGVSVASAALLLILLDRRADVAGATPPLWLRLAADGVLLTPLITFQVMS